MSVDPTVGMGISTGVAILCYVIAVFILASGRSVLEQSNS
jgi:hypothetical protein